MPDATGFLSVDEILEADDKKIEEVEVPEWNGKVRLRVLSGAERGKIEALVQNKNGKVPIDFRERLLAMSICGEDGKRLFTDQQIGQLQTRSAAALDRLFDSATKLNRFSAEDVEELSGN